MFFVKHEGTKYFDKNPITNPWYHLPNLSNRQRVLPERLPLDGIISLYYYASAWGDWLAVPSPNLPN